MHAESKLPSLGMRGITLPGFSAHYLPALLTWQVLINEILASNTAGLKDSSGKASDWLELRNTGSSTEDLGVGGWGGCPQALLHF